MGDSRIVISVIVGVLILGLTIPGVMGHGNVDQSFTGPYNLDMGLFTPAGQTFTPTASELSGVDIFLSSTALQTRSVTVSILQGSEINSGIEIDSVTREIDFPQRSSFLDFIEYHFDFDPPVPLIPDQPYGIKIDTGVQTIGSPGNNGNLYPGGGASQLGSPVSSSPVDIGFRTYFIPSNNPPDCSGVVPDSAVIPSNFHKTVDVILSGFTDVDGDPVTFSIDTITQDEPTSGSGKGDKSPDGFGVGTDTVQVRVERDGNGDGRVYEISFTADDGNGGTCPGSVSVAVPHDKSHDAVDSGQIFDSTLP